MATISKDTIEVKSETKHKTFSRLTARLSFPKRYSRINTDEIIDSPITSPNQLSKEITRTSFVPATTINTFVDVNDQDQLANLTISSQYNSTNLVYAKTNYVLFYIMFSDPRQGFFRDIIDISKPVQNTLETYKQFYHFDGTEIQLKFVSCSPIKINSSKRLSLHRVRSYTNSNSDYVDIDSHKTWKDQLIDSSNLLILSAKNNANFQSANLDAYLTQKSDHSLFMEQWLPAIQGNYPLSYNEGCTIAACLYHLYSTLNQISDIECNNDVTEFLPKFMTKSKSKINTISLKLFEIRNESYDTIKKLCLDTILANFLSDSLCFQGTCPGTTLSTDNSIYLLINRQALLVVKQNALDKIVTEIPLTDIKSWKYKLDCCEIEYNTAIVKTTCRQENTIIRIKANDAMLIVSALTAITSTLSKK